MDPTSQELKDQSQPPAQVPQEMPEEIPATEPEPSASLEELGKSEQEQDDSFAWLENLAAKQGATEGLLTTPEERLAEEPDWVKQAKDLSAEQLSAPEQTPAMDDTAVWMRSLDEEAASEPAPPRMRRRFGSRSLRPQKRLLLNLLSLSQQKSCRPGCKTLKRKSPLKRYLISLSMRSSPAQLRKQLLNYLKRPNG